MGKKKTRCTWQISDEFWEKIEPIIPVRKNTHPRGGGKKPTPPRKIMNTILFVLRTGCQWKALDATGILPGSTANDWFQKWAKQGVFLSLWKLGLTKYDELCESHSYSFDILYKKHNFLCNLAG